MKRAIIKPVTGADCRLVSILLFVAVCAAAQQTGALHGSVVDSDGEPLPLAVIQVTATDSKRSYQWWAEAGGRFRVEKIEPGEYRVVIQYGGFREKSIAKVMIGAGEDVDLGFQTLALLGGSSLDCGNHMRARSKPVAGPGGVTAVVQVDSRDDASKETHDCEAVYTLRIAGADGKFVLAGHILTSDARWERRLSLHLDGFSQDGKHVFGVISEGGEYSFAMPFHFEISSHRSTGPYIKEGLQVLRAAKCGTAFAVAGVTAAGVLVLEPNTADPCRMDHRWLADANGGLRELPKGQSFSSLYSAGAL